MNEDPFLNKEGEKLKKFRHNIPHTKHPNFFYFLSTFFNEPQPAPTSEASSRDPQPHLPTTSS